MYSLKIKHIPLRSEQAPLQIKSNNHFQAEYTAKTNSLSQEPLTSIGQLATSRNL